VILRDRGQWTPLPECLDDFIDESNPVRVVDVFVDALDLAEMSFEGVEPAATGRPSYRPLVLLKLHIYGYLNRVQSSRRLERDAPPHKNASKGSRRDGSIGSGVKSNTGHEPCRGQAADHADRGLKHPWPWLPGLTSIRPF